MQSLVHCAAAVAPATECFCPEAHHRWAINPLFRRGLWPLPTPPIDRQMRENVVKRVLGNLIESFQISEHLWAEIYENLWTSIQWGFKFQIEIGDLDFETGIWAETYHNWAKIDDAGSPWIHGPRQSSNMLIGSIQWEKFITGLILGWFCIFLGGGLIWTQTYSR